MDDSGTSTPTTCDESDSTDGSSNVENSTIPCLPISETHEEPSVRTLSVETMKGLQGHNQLKQSKEIKNANQGLLNPEIDSFRTSLRSKKSPWSTKPWIDLSLTLDGRDKITKVIQYTSRLLGFYYESLLSLNTSASDAKQLALKAKQFRNLQKSLTSSRKAYRFGRSIIEINKLREMGLLELIAQYLIKHMGRAFNCLQIRNGTAANDDDKQHLVGKKITWHSEVCNQKQFEEIKPSSSTKSFKPTLPRCVSSNVGWGPGANKHSMRKAFPFSSYLYSSMSTGLDDQSDKELNDIPLAKLVATCLKLSGLAGFWAADNVSYLYSVGFFDSAIERRKKTSIFATRSYFLAATSGLYLNIKEFLRHRSGPLRDAAQKTMQLRQAHHCQNLNEESLGIKTDRDELEKAFQDLKNAQRKHFKNSLALLKVSLHSF